MRTTLDFVVALTTGLLLGGAMIGGAFLALCAAFGTSCWWLWRKHRGRR
ncbi:MAG: hypothetical protein ACK4UL_03655 [Novosphingobium meiothermophilum]|nr:MULTISPECIES: hypothetical protein [Novosphingobium]